MTNKTADDKLFSGFVLGVFVGAIYGFFSGPRLNVSEMLSSDATSDGNSGQNQSLRTSIEEGREAAHDRKRLLRRRKDRD